MPKSKLLSYFLFMFLVCSVQGCGLGKKSSYLNSESMTTDFDKVYQPKPDILPFGETEFLIGVSGNSASVYTKLKDDQRYERLSSSSFEERVRSMYEKSGQLRITRCSFSQNFNDGLITLSWSFAHSDTRGLGVNGGQTDNMHINLKNTKIIK